MKFTYKILSILFITLCVSCTNFLTVLPDSSYSVNGAYKTQSDFVQAIAAVYDKLQSLYNSNTSVMYMDQLRTDETNVITPQNPTGYLGGIERFIDTDNDGSLTGIYSSYYTIINRCNTILDKINNVAFSDSILKKSIKGEALMLRAYGYWSLGWQFGGVPIIKSVKTVQETLTIPRSKQDETFKAAEDDYLAAINLLPAQWTGNSKGRVTKYAAMGMLARMYMFQHKYSSAIPQLQAIISSGAYSMESDYKNCFSESHENGSERVWEVQFMGGQSGEGQQFTTGCLPSDYTGTLQPFVGFSSFPIISSDLISAYESGDLRKDLSTTTNVKWNGSVDTKSYFIRKFHYADVNTPKVQNDWGVNLPILRYTDVKMMYAEALNEVNYIANGEAFSILKDVRARAGLVALTSTDLPNQDAFRQAIYKERRVEFAFEGIRWMDLIRWGVAMDVMNKFLANPVQDGGKYQMKAYQTLYAIPLDEINRYNNQNVMWQNPGYSSN